MNNLKKIREKRNVTQIKLSMAIGVSQETISAYESGKSLPSADTLIKIAEFLNTSTDYLLGRIKEDSSLRSLMNDTVDKQLDELVNNYALLSTDNKENLVWYSEVLKEKK